jgi:hypothetical protein
MWCLLFETQIEGLLCDKNPNEDSKSNSHGYTIERSCSNVYNMKSHRH